MFVINATKLAHQAAVCNVPLAPEATALPAGAAAQGGDIRLGRCPSWGSSVSSSRLPALRWAQAMSRGTLPPPSPGDFLQPRGTRSFPHAEHSQSCSLFQRDGAAGGSPRPEEHSGQDPELWDPAELNPSQFRIPGGSTDSRWQRLSVCPSLPVLPLPTLPPLPFIIFAPSSSLLRGSPNSPPRTAAVPPLWGWEAPGWGCCW